MHAARARDHSPTFALAAMRRCSSTRDASTASRCRSLEVDAAEFAAAERALDAAQRQALDRAIANVRRFHEAQLGDAAARRDFARRRLRTSLSADRCRRPLCAGRRRSPALRRHHAGGAGANCRLPDAHHLHAAAQGWHGRSRRADGRAICAASSVCSRSAARRRSPRWPTARRAIPKVDKVFGPGNSWVTAAKLLVANDPDGAALDLPAGPSEVLVIADDTARAEFVAADLLAQAEHSADAQAILVTTSQRAGRGDRCSSSRRRCSGSAARARCANRSITARIVRRRLARRGVRGQQRLRARASDRAGRRTRAPGCRRSATPARCSSAPGRRKRWATTAAARITCCRPTASHAPTAACRWPIS